MPKKLTRLRIDEVSSVDRGAGEGVKVMLMKRNTDGKNIGKFFADLFRRTPTVDIGQEVNKAVGALATSLSTIGDDPELIGKTFEQFQDHLTGVMEKAQTTGSVVDKRGESDMDLVQLKKALGLADSATEADVTAAIAKNNETVAKLAQELEIAKANMSNDEHQFHDTLKDEEAKKSFRAKTVAARKDQMNQRDDVPDYIKKILKRNEELEQRIAVVEGGSQLEAMTKRATDIGLPDTEGQTIMKARGGDKEAVIKLEEIIKALHAQVKAAGLFTERGDNRGGGARTAYDEIVAKAEELRKIEKTLTPAQAFEKVYTDPANVELARRERLENRPAAA
jgi:hypothetical protein